MTILCDFQQDAPNFTKVMEHCHQSYVQHFGWMDFPKKAQNPTLMDVDSSLPSRSATLFLEKLRQ
jgi:hypothetical protein